MESKVGPLREVVQRGQRAFGATQEQLSCDHFMSALRSRPAKKRRCLQCHEEAEAAKKKTPPRAEMEQALLARMKEVRELLEPFGLSLHGFDPGVTAYLKDRPRARGRGYFGEPITFDAQEWAWLEPLLKELPPVAPEPALRPRAEPARRPG